MGSKIATGSKSTKPDFATTGSKTDFTTTGSNTTSKKDFATGSTGIKTDYC
jgi:hypothetical protein